MTRPGAGGEVWPETQTFNITWRFALAPVNGSTPPAGTVDINLLLVGSSTPVLNIASGVPNNGQFSWTLPNTITPGSNYLVQVTSDQYAGLTATSPQPFTVAAPVHTYYVNDGTVNPGDWTTAPGNDSNDGLTPATPKASIAGVLAAYHLNPGDTILVDAGTYDLNNALLLNAAASGIIIEGYDGVNYPASAAIFNRGLSSSDVIDVSGATNLTLESLTMTGGAIGIDALDNSGSSNLTIRNCTVYGNNSTGIYIGEGDNNAVIANNTVYGLPHNSNPSDDQPTGIELGYSGVNDALISGNVVHDSYGTGILVSGNDSQVMVSNNEVYACGTGIYANTSSSGVATLSTVSSNTIFNNNTGINAAGDVLVTQNVVYGQSGRGISGGNVYEVLANTVYDNAVGIYAYSSGGAIANNVVYHNSGDGIEAESNSPVTGNTVYGNATGIALDYISLGPVSNNLIYENTNQGILVTYYGSLSIINNTIYQPAGDAIDIQDDSSNVTLNNNILWTQAGYDINVDPTSEIGFQSDYNDLYTTGSGSIGSWEGQTFSSLTEWILELNLDRDSLSVDPQFVNPEGADGIVGYSTTPIGAAQVIDDSSATGFSTTGVWTSLANATADNGEELMASAGSGNAVATWTFTGLTPGATYQVSASWGLDGYELSLASDAPFSVLDGSQLVSLTYQSEYYNPSIPGTPSWQPLGNFVTTTGTLTVQLSNAAMRAVVADAVMIQQIQGNGGADDNFHLAAGSPAVAAGNPADSVGQEPIPNGGRIDLGAYGGTPQATASPVSEVQVLTPADLDKLQQGQQVNVAWRTAGVYAPPNYYSSAVLADQPLAYYQLDDTSGTTATDSSGNGLNATYVGGVQLGQPGALPFESATAITFDGSTGYVQLPTLSNDFTSGFSAEVWAYPTSVASYERFFDLGNGAYADNIVLYRVGTSNDLAFVVFDGGSEGTPVVANNAIALDQWQYFAVTMDAAGNVTLYKNGVAIASGTTDDPNKGVVRVENYLGKSNFSNNALYAGGLDEAAIYARPLSAAQIAAHYAQLVYGTANVELLQNGAPVETIATGVPDSGSYSWTIPTNVTLGGGYQVQVTVNNGSQPSGVSAPFLQITGSATDYYVAANGSDSNTGTDSSDPMASLSALLTAYPTLSSGDTVHIGPGSLYVGRKRGPGAGHSGLTITGPVSGPPAVLTRNNPALDVIDVSGATNLTLESLTMTGGAIGIDALDNSGSSNLTIRNCTVYGNNSTGIYVGDGDNNAVIANNTVYGLPHDSSSSDDQPTGIELGYSGVNDALISGNVVHDSYGTGILVSGNDSQVMVSNNEVYACGTGIYANTSSSGVATLSTVSSNTIFNNNTGINAAGDVLVTQNVVYGQSGRGISGGNVYEVLANTVYDNAVGIYAYSSGGAIANNVVYHNSGDGIEAEHNSPVTGNTVYGNATGIALDYISLGPASNNLIYENTDQGILVSYISSPSITNNTIYQPTGDAIDIQDDSSNVTLNNNILWSQAGYDINVDPTSEVGFQSDYNDLYATGSGKLGSWQGQAFVTQQDWYYQIGQDQHSLSVDPQFINPAGADGILGYSTTPIGAAQIIDDSSASGFSTTGLGARLPMPRPTTAKSSSRLPAAVMPSPPGPSPA